MSGGGGPFIRLADAPAALVAFPAVCFQKAHGGLEDLNAALRERILTEERERPGETVGVSIQGGYHSDTRFLDRDDDVVGRLRSVLVADVAEYVEVYWRYESAVELAWVRASDSFPMRIWGWSVVLRAGDSSELHAHPHANLSGVYYVSNTVRADPGEPNAGNLVLCDPRAGAGVAPVIGQISRVRIPPVPGGTVIFPSYLQHYVSPFRGAGERISVAFNVRFEGAAVEAADLKGYPPAQ